MEVPTRLNRRILRRYILADERIVVATRKHWAVILWHTVLLALAFVVTGALATYLGDAIGSTADLVWVLWFAFLGSWLWRVLQWRTEWFVATDKRLLLVYGLVTHKVAMMPLGKVTDMSYSRSIAGRILGYGQFLLESAGQDQALRQIDWVSDPDSTYRKLCDTLFNPGGSSSSDEDEDEAPQDAWDAAPDADGWFEPTAARDDAPPPPTVRPGPATMAVRHGPVHRTADPVPPPPPVALDGDPRHSYELRTQPIRLRTAPPSDEYPPTGAFPIDDVSGPGWDVSHESRGTFVRLDAPTTDDER